MTGGVLGLGAQSYGGLAMMRVWFRFSLTFSIVAVAACASSTPPPDTEPEVHAAPKKKGPLPHSSIAAVLEHRVDLALSEEQITKLEELDKKLELDDLSIRKNASEANAASTKPSSDSTASDAQKSGDMGGPRGMGMGGMGRRGMGGMGVGGAGSRHGGYGGGAKADQAPNPNSPEVIRQRLDDNDTAAYLEAEKVFTEEQRPKARAIAEQYRADLWDRRQGL